MTEKDDVISVQFLFRPSMSNSAMENLSQLPQKKSTQWTHKLASLADEESAEPNPAVSTRLSNASAKQEVDTSLRLEGPYFTPANPEAYKTVVCLVAGTGLSGAIAISAAFQAQGAKPQPTTEATAPVEGAVSTIAAESNRRWTRCVVRWSIREKDFVDMPFFNGKRCATRPEHLLNHCAEEHQI